MRTSERLLSQTWTQAWTPMKMSSLIIWKQSERGKGRCFNTGVNFLGSSAVNCLGSFNKNCWTPILSRLNIMVTILVYAELRRLGDRPMDTLHWMMSEKVQSDSFYPCVVRHFVTEISQFIEVELRQYFVDLVKSTCEPLDNIRESVFAGNDTNMGFAQRRAREAIQDAISRMEKLQTIFDST